MEKTPVDSNIERATGIRRVVAAFRYSMQGLTRLWQEEAFRHELIAGAAGVLLFALVGASALDYFVFAILMLVMRSFSS